MSQTTTRPTVNLEGCDGNAFGILARAERAYRAAGLTAEWPALRDQMTAGDYDHLLATLVLACDVTFGDDDEMTEAEADAEWDDHWAEMDEER